MLIPLMTLVLAAQQATPVKPPPDDQPKPKPEFVRALGPSRTRYQVKVTVNTGDTVTRTYQMEMVVAKTKSKDDAPTVSFKIENIVTKFFDHEITQPSAGAITVPLPSTGFLTGLSLLPDAVPYSMPLLAFWLPDDKQEDGKWVSTTSPQFDPGFDFVGDSRVTHETSGLVTLTLDLRLRAPGEKEIDYRLRRYRSSAEIDPKTGSVIQADGRYTNDVSSVSFELKRL